ncbi:hypothetical protein [Thalassobellus citreus]|uniref:hypothetical protein n=1 Tax=Thalassobellus citreus TaxID=3367752 RepID=UPI0037929AC0
MLYYLLIALKAYCIYHAYKNNSPYYWYFLIFIIPFGSIIYLIIHVYNKRDAEKITSEITNIINPTKKIKDLEKQLQFSESYQNRVNLADAYLGIKDFNNAIIHYLESIEGNLQNDLYVFKQLIECYFNIEDYEKVVLYAEKIKDHLEFKKSRTQFLYGLALEKIGRVNEAEDNLKAIDIRYSFYNERIIYAKFLYTKGETEAAKEVLEEIKTESLHMTKPNKRLYRAAVQEAEMLLKDYNVSS